MDKIDAMIIITRDYKNHPLGVKFCKKCDYPMYPPAYPGDYWDCANSECANTIAPTKNQIEKMLNRK